MWVVRRPRPTVLPKHDSEWSCRGASELPEAQYPQVRGGTAEQTKGCGAADELVYSFQKLSCKWTQQVYVGRFKIKP
jgi:hypothetical protein